MSIKSSGSLGLNEIDSEYGLGTNLGVYRNQPHWTSTNKTNTLYFSSTGLAYSEFYSTSAGGSGYVVDFTGSTSWNVPTNGTCAMLLVAGGGSAGYTTSYYLEGGGGGGAGGVKFVEGLTLVGGGRIDVSIGGGGSWAGNGNDSSVSCYHSNGTLLWSYGCTGGGHGAAPRSFTAGNGGSGGGGCPWYGRDLRGYTVGGGQGNNGGFGQENYYGGGGGGAGSDGGYGTPGGGGIGRTVGYFGITYSVGGGGGSGGQILGNVGAGGAGGGGGAGGDGAPNTGGGAGGGYNTGYRSGGSGRCVVWWSK